MPYQPAAVIPPILPKSELTDDPDQQLAWFREYLILNADTLGVMKFGDLMVKTVMAKCAVKRASGLLTEDDDLEALQRTMESK